MRTSSHNATSKKLTPENWLEGDGAACHWVRTRDGVVTRMTAKQWGEVFLRPALERSVPLEVQEFLDVARSLLCYGYFFYPLYTLGTAQLYRVLEAALFLRCDALKAPKKQTFTEMVAWLHARGVIEAERVKQWDTGRKFRTAAPRPGTQRVGDPPIAAHNLEITVGLINALYRVTAPNT
jgi:hypothetical protein